MNLRIFCDFDGTIAVNDVGNLIFTEFGDKNHWWGLVEEWKAGTLEGREMWRKQSEITKITVEQMDTFARQQPIDKTFPGFIEFCYAHDFPVYIISDGMDAYITRILNYNGLGFLQVRANQLLIGKDGALSVSFPYYKPNCCNCGNCKGQHVVNERQEGETTVYIGDGYSDVCGIKEADIVFAKSVLYDYCVKHDIACHLFHSFADVHRILRAIVDDVEQKIALKKERV